MKNNVISQIPGHSDNEKFEKFFVEKMKMHRLKQKIQNLTNDELHHFSKRDIEILEALKKMVS